MQEELMDLFFKLKELNPNIKLTGSLALNLQNVKTRTEPNDLDVYLPLGEELNMLEGFEETEQEDYPEEDYNLFQYSNNKIKIDVFQPTNKLEYGISKIISYKDVKINVIKTPVILRHKFNHAFSINSTTNVCFKQTQDLGYIFTNLWT